MAHLPPTIIRVLQAGHGIAARRQLLAIDDITQGRVKSWVRHGKLVRYAYGVVGVPGLPETRDNFNRITLARCWPQARLGPQSSLSRLGIEGFTRSDRDPPDIVVPPNRRLGHHDITAHYIQLTRGDRAMIGGLPGLSVARSLTMIAHLMPPKVLRVAIDDAVRRQKTSKNALLHRADRLPSLAGAAAIRSLLRDDPMQSESEGERRLWQFLSQIQPPPERQVTDLVPGRRLDFAWRQLRFALESDGRAYHNPATARDADGLRDLEAGAANVMIQRITYGMITHDLERTMQLIGRALSQRAAQLGVAAPALPPLGM